MPYSLFLLDRIFRLFPALLLISAVFQTDLQANAAQEEAPVADRDRQVRERLVIAGRQRMLAEALAAKLCFAEAGVMPVESRNELYVMWNIFGWYHQGFRKGNRELELGPELNRDVLLAWQMVDSDWRELREIYAPALSQNSVAPSEVERAVVLTGSITDATTNLVAKVRSAYADELGPRGFGSALLLDLYERQRMLGERIAKGVCLVSRGDASDEQLAELTRTIQIFSVSMEAFQNGREDAGVPTPPNAKIARSLADALSHWRPVAAFAYASAVGQQLGAPELTEFAGAMNLFIVSMTAAINDLASHQNKERG